jgi:hypothetical protein
MGRWNHLNAESSFIRKKPLLLVIVGSGPTQKSKRERVNGMWASSRSSRRLRQPRSRTLSSLVLVVVVFLAMSPDRAVGAQGKTKARSQVRSQASKQVVIGKAQSIAAPFVIRSSSAALDARGRAALELLRFDYEDAFPGWTISFLPGRQRLLGLTLVGERQVEIYIRKDRPVEGIAHDIAHEFGHIVDVTYNNDQIRSRYLKARGLSAETPWWACNSCRDLEVGAGDFAEVFAHIVAPRFAFYSKLKSAPSEQVSETIRTEVLAPALRVRPLVEPAPPPGVPTAEAAGPGSVGVEPETSSGATLAPVLVPSP